MKRFTCIFPVRNVADGNGEGVGAGGAQGAAQRPQTFTAPTWAHFTVQDNTENLDLTQLQNITTHARGKRRLLVFAGTDYGVAKMSETVAVTQAQIQTHINRYYQLYDSPAAQPPAAPPPSPAVGLQAPPPVVPPPAPTQTLTPQQRQQQLNQVKLPPSHEITAPMIDDVSHTRKIARRRETWLKGKATVKAALEELSKPENVFQRARQEVDDRHKVRSKHRGLLRGFENSGKRLKDLHNQRLREDLVQGSSSRKTLPLTAAPAPAGQVSPMDGWCHHCNRHHIPSRPDAKRFRYDVNCPKFNRNKPFIFPVLMIGNAGTGVGSRIKSHSRRGGGKMRAEHRRYCTVGMTDEYRSPKTCVYCSHQVRQARARRVDRINKTIKTVNVNGTVECVNPNCISLSAGTRSSQGTLIQP
ncbi:hypothetical protein KVV02_002477 [Mortierella alpina]|uniref:Uncharacterized protein n=1 Tax=Mortierella alpina TaxID=64518 RepID=A0A9P8CU91_MORAP|nr:hypothetical protein KVV02_002477 [Mortierella alpina]